MTFKAVPITRLANAAGEDAELWLAARQAEAEKAGVGLLAKTLPGASGKEEINIVLTIIKRELICVSSLLPERDGAMAFARMVKADVLDGSMRNTRFACWSAAR